MLKLTQEQYDWMCSVQQARASLALVAVLDEQWPALVAKLGARKQAFVEAALQQADQLGLDDPTLAARFLNLWCVWGPSFIDKPGFEWAGAIARDLRLDPWGRVDQLSQQTADRLSANAQAGIDQDKFFDADHAMAAVAGGPGAAPWSKGALNAKPMVRAQCDLSALDVAIAEQPWRGEYRLAWSGAELLARHAPLAVPVQRFRTDTPLPPDTPLVPRQLAALACPANRINKAWLLVRSSMAHVCDATVHPRVEIKTDAGGQVFQGTSALLVKVPLHSADLMALPPPFPAPKPEQAPKAGDPVRTDFSKGILGRMVLPRHLLVSAQTCAYRRYGAPLGEQQAVVAIHPADQWLLEVRSPAQPHWHWPETQAKEAVAPPVVRLERDGVPVASNDWARAWAQLNAALLQGLEAWHGTLTKAQVLLNPRLDIEPGLMHGCMAWTWGMREVVSDHGSSAFMRMQALIKLVACSMNLAVAGELRHLGAHARIRLHAQGKAVLEHDLLHETAEAGLAEQLATLKASWRFPFEVEVESMSSPALATICRAPGGSPGAVVGELGLRPRPDGAGWAWYCTLKLEASLVPLVVIDPQSGQTTIQRDLWPETVLLDWSAG
jgi:hypothetical protein